VTYQLPSTFKNFISDSTITLTARTDNTTNGVVTYDVFRSSGSAITECSSPANTATTVTSTVNTWQTVGISGLEKTGCSFAASDRMIIKVNVTANSNANVYVSDINFTYTNQ
jgi:hypothetical protein